MDRLVYSPQVQAFIMLENKRKLLDVTEDIVNGNVNRRINAMSDARLTLQNKNGRYTKQNVIQPMDRIVIKMSRVGKPFLTFSGYVDDAPYYQIYPGLVTVAASCTIKLLQNTYFDPGLPAVQQWFSAHNWTWQPDTGTLTDVTGGLGDDDLYGSAADLIYQLLTDIGNWPKNAIDIWGLPTEFIDNIKLVMQAENGNAKDIADYNGKLLAKLYGVTDAIAPSASGSQAANPTHGNVSAVTVARYILDAGWSGNDAVIALAIAMAESSLISDNDNKSPACTAWPTGERCLGLWQINGNHLGSTVNGVTMSSADVAKDPRLSTLYAFGLYKNRGGTGNGGSSTRWDDWQAYTGPGGSGNSSGPYSGYMPEAETAVKQALLSPSSDLTVSTTSTKDQASIVRTATQVKMPPELKGGIASVGATVLENNPGLSITSTTGGTHATNSYHYRGMAVDLGGSAETMANAVTYIKGSGLTTTLAEGIHNPGLSIKDGKDVPPSFWGQETWDNHTNHIHLAVEGDQPQTGSGYAGTGDSAAGVPGGYTAQQIAQFGAQGSFFAEQFASSDTTLASVLTGHRALANDVSVLEWIKTAVPASGRVWCSKPDGEFLAFFPDRFGYFKRTPYFYINDIEIVDLTINRNDTNLITHVFTTGPMIPQSGITVFDRMYSMVASVEDTAFKYFINVDKSFDPLAFLARHGAKPYVNDITNINHPLLLWMNGWMKFSEMWANRFSSTATFTFMPELFPGGLVSFGGRVQMFLESVSHSFDMAGGFSTTAELSALSAIDTDTFKELPNAGSFDPDVIAERFDR